MDRIELLRFLQEDVGEGELKTICFKLQVDYESLAAVGKADKALQLVEHLERRERLAELEGELAQLGVVGDGVPLALRPYLELTARRYGRLPLGPLDPSGQESSRVSLGQIFVNLYAGVAVQPLAQPDDDKHEFYRAAVAHIFHNRQLILLGDPGSGKSTLLRFLAYCLAQHHLSAAAEWLEKLNWQVGRRKYDSEESELIYGRNADLKRLFKESQLSEQHWTGDAPLPVFIELRDFARTRFDPADPLALWQFVESRLALDGLEACAVPLKRLAENGRLLFLLDGVDEVPMGERPSIWQAISALEDGVYGGNCWLTTCRILSFAAAEAPKGIPTQTLRLLDEEQIEQFIESWYTALFEAGELNRAELETKMGNLQTAVQQPRLQPLAQNPMLLTIIAIVQTYYGTLPDQRAKLYQACVETLLLRWQRHKEAEAVGELPNVLEQLGTTQEDLERLLWEIGWQAHSGVGGREDAADIPEWDVLQIARQHLGSLSQAEAFLTYTERRAHLLVGRGGQKERVYTFPHRTFQEYLAACHLAAMRRFPRKAAALAAESDSWRETLNLAVGTLLFNQNNREKAIDGVEGVLPRRTPDLADEGGWRQVWLAGEMMLTVGREVAEKDDVGQEILPRLRQMLAALLEKGRLTVAQRAEAGEVLGLLGDPRPGVCTLEPEIIEIESGPFLIHDEKYTVHVDAFAIGKYPVTNAQFEMFMADGGYENQAFWTEEGWEYRQKKDWTRPRFWEDSDFSTPNKPVVGISWYEALAYCNWLSAKTERPYRLPTEAEWERAARHTDGRKYPWGNQWQDGIVNSEEAEVGRTTAVGSFPDSTAACGAQDMSGNVWEWCQTRYVSQEPYRGDDGREDLSGGGGRVLRGGSWYEDKGPSRCAARNRLDPWGRGIILGFRCCATSSLPPGSES